MSAGFPPSAAATHRGSGIAGPQGSDAFDRLNEASVALLEPLLDAALRDDPQLLAQRLSEAISNCAQIAASVGLRSLNYLATLLVPFLQRQASEPGWPRALEWAEVWIGDVVTFCGGQMPASEAPGLVACLQDWPEFAPVPEHFVQLIAGRLRQDAQIIARMAADAQADEVRAADERAADERAADERAADERAAVEALEALEPAGTDTPGAIEPVERPPFEPPALGQRAARDEFEMLADALDVLREGLGASTPRLPGQDGEGDAALDADAIELCRDRLGHLESAAGYVGVDALAIVLRTASASLERWREAPSRVGGHTIELLRELPVRLGAYLRSPDARSAAGVAALLAAPGWPVALTAHDLDAVEHSLASVELIGSRRVSATATEITEDDLSLAIPGDVDARTLDNLLRELPVLSARFSEGVARALAGSGEGLAQAQRAAHTLKGSANTVGVRGIATLTHQLEDLLQLLSTGGRRIPSVLAGQLELAADCLGEMTDAVAGLGPAPGDALQVCRSLAGWVARLLEGDDGSDAGAPSGQAERAWDEPEETVETVETAPGPATPESAEVDRAEAGLAGLAGPDVPAEPIESVQPVEAAGAAEAIADEEVLRVPAPLIDRLLDLAGEASMLLAQAQEQLGQIGDTRGSFRGGTERLQELAGELERLVDVRGVSLTGRRGRGEFDALELDEFNELHTVSRRIAEAGADHRVLEQQLYRQASILSDVSGQLERVHADLRDVVMSTRMVPVSAIAPRLQRALRQAARMLGKQARLVIDGEATGVDAQLLHALLDPLTHLLRNAADHGIEHPQQREQAGKAPVGTVTLCFARVGRNLRIRCTDDGAGLDFAAIRARAEELGLVEPQGGTRREELARLILQPGFSTRRAATQLSGRGIGLDVVHRDVTALRGTVRVESHPGAGTEVEIEVPGRMVTLAAVVARSPSHVLALAVRGIEQLVPADAVVTDDRGEPRFVYRDGFVPVVYLDEALGLPRGHFARESAAARAVADTGSLAGAAETGIAAIVRRDDGELLALITPELSQTRNLVVRPLPVWLRRIEAIEGAAVLGDGSVAPVIDLPTLLSRAPDADAVPVAVPFEPRPLPVCLVVDDSVSVRRSMEAFMHDLGFAVDTAGDGVEALALIERRVPNLAIVDLEMPRMNGIELAAALRADERTHGIGLIMITSRYSEKHRAMAIDAGVDAFMTKPYTEDELAASVRSCLEARAG